MPAVCQSLCFFNDTATTEIYTLSLHDALPIFTGLLALSILGDVRSAINSGDLAGAERIVEQNKPQGAVTPDRKSTRLNSSHANISYAVFCLNKTNAETPYIVSRFARNEIGILH